MPQSKEKEDEVRWVEQRVREREYIDREQKESIPGCQRRHPEWRKNGALSKVAYLAWLLDERDGLSFDRVGERVFAKEHDESDSVEAGGKSAGEPDSRKMRAYRAW